MYVKIIKSGHTYEIYSYEREPASLTRTGRPRNVPNRSKRPSKRTGLNAERTRKNFIRIVRSNFGGEELPSLLTLTMRDIVSLSVGYGCLTGFISNLRRVAGKGFRYVAVPEFQKRGAVHFHILVWGLPQILIENERGNRYLQNLWALGYVDCVPTDGSPKLAGYLAKYMSKSMSDDRIAGQKAYVCSRNTLRPVSYAGHDISALPADFWGSQSVTISKRTFDTKWMGRATYEMIAPVDKADLTL